MVCIPETICGRESDLLFSYPTLKYVRILDARLGFFKHLLTLSILIYIGVWQLWGECRYLEEGGVTGAVRMTLQQPTKGGCNPTLINCKNDFQSIETLSYCKQSNITYEGNKWSCQFYENVGAQVVMSNTILAGSRITQYQQTLVCNSTTSDTCPFIYNLTEGQKSKKTWYVADAERFTVLVDHSVMSDSAKSEILGYSSLQAGSASMKGRLFVEKNNALCKEFRHSATTDYRGELGKTNKAPCYIAPNVTSKNLDYFTIDVLMRAADKNLDAVNYDGQTYRETGVTMLLQIVYSNFRGNFKGKGSIQYYYKPRLVTRSSYNYYSPEYSDYRSLRTLNNIHGVFIEAIQGGSLYTWSFNNLLIQLTTSLTLFAVATVVTDFVALYIMPEHGVYEKYIYEETKEHFARDGMRHTEHGSDNARAIEELQTQTGSERSNSMSTLEYPLSKALLEDDEIPDIEDSGSRYVD